MATPCGSCKNRRFGKRYGLHHPGDWPHGSQRGCTSRRTRKIASCNDISIVLSECYREDTVDYPLLRRMSWWQFKIWCFHGGNNEECCLLPAVCILAANQGDSSPWIWRRLIHTKRRFLQEHMAWHCHITACHSILHCCRHGNLKSHNSVTSPVTDTATSRFVAHFHNHLHYRAPEGKNLIHKCHFCCILTPMQPYTHIYCKRTSKLVYKHLRI
jgi:hypothetical protein